VSRRFLSGLVATLALTLPLTLVAVAGTPSSASAIGSPATPLSVLPSQIVSGTSAATSADAQLVRMAQVYKFITSPATVEALRSQAAGTATKTETDLIAAAAKKVRIPTGLGGLVKGAGAAGVAYTGWEIGTFMGTGPAGAITTELWGVDANDLVCGQAAAGSVGQGLLSFFSGQKCADFNARPGQPINGDTKTGGMTTGDICLMGGDGQPTQCVRLVGTDTFSAFSSSSAWTLDQAGQNNISGYVADTFCFRATKGAAFTPGVVFSDGVRQVTEYPHASFWPGYGCSAGDMPITRPARATYKTSEVVGFFNGQPGVQPNVPFDTGATTNPDRYISCDVTGTGPSFISTPGEMFTEADQDWSKSVPACGTLPAGEIPTNTKLTLHTIGGADEVLWTRDTPPEVVTDLGKGGKYQTCLTTVCQLILEKNGTSCFDGTDCTGWFADSQTGTSTNRYECKYAGQAVALSECSVYKPTWEAANVRTGEVYADPVTGTPAKNSPVKTEQAASPVKGTDAGTFGEAVQDPAGERQCFPTGWAVFNPVEWVQKPVQCAFQWAFVPKPSVLASAKTQIATDLDQSGLGTITRNVTMLGAVPIPGNGCGGIPLRFELAKPAGVKVDTHLLSACPGETLAPVAATTKTILSGLVVTAGFLAILRYIATIFGFSGLGGIQQEFRMSDKRAESAAREAAK
jgi:hypothetical protein